MDAIQLEPVALTGAVTCADGAKPRTWNQVCKLGQFNGHPAGPFEISRDTYREILTNWLALGRQPIPVDLDHRIELEGGPAVAWVVGLEVRAGDELWAEFEWVDPDVVTQVRAGQWGYLSPALRFRALDPVSGEESGARLTSVALTTQPFLRGMQPVAARDAAPPAPPSEPLPPAADPPTAPATSGTAQETVMSELKTIALAAGLEANAAESAIVEAIKAMERRAKAHDREVASLQDRLNTWELADSQRRETAARDAVDALGIDDPATRADLMALYQADEQRFRRLASAGALGGRGAASARSAQLMSRVAPRGGSAPALLGDNAGKTRGQLIDERAQVLMAATPNLSYEQAALAADREYSNVARRALGQGR